MTLVSLPVITLVPDTPLVNSIDPISLMDRPLGSSGSPMEDNVIAEINILQKNFKMYCNIKVNDHF